MKKIILALAAVASVSVLSGCVVDPSTYSNVELAQCANRGKVFMRHDTFGLCGEELAKRMHNGKVDNIDLMAGGLGTQASIQQSANAATTNAALIGAAGNVAAAQNQSVAVHAGY